MSDVTHDRGKVYGDFYGHAAVSQGVKKVLLDALSRNEKFCQLPADKQDVLKEGLEMIANKLGRIVNGDPTYADSFVDIEGYSKITRIRVCEENN